MLLCPPEVSGLADAREVVSAEVGPSRGASSLTGWLRCSHHLAPNEASRLVKAARSLREQLPATACAMAGGQVNLGQVEVMVEALKDLSADVTAEQRAEGEQTLIRACESLDPVALGRFGRRLEELLDPDGVQARDEAKIRDHEETAFGKRELTFSPDPYGSGGTIRGRYDAAGYAVITAMLEPLCTPWSNPSTAPGTGACLDPVAGKDLRSPAARRYDALVEVCRRGLNQPTTTCGEGGKAQVRVTIPLASLRDRTGYGLLDDGTEISPTLARMLACEAGFIPAVLGSHGQPIDVGREQRLFKGAARTAIEVRDGGCTWPGCSRPASWCQIHHLIPWSENGRTDQVNGGLFCWHHHREIEKAEWEPSTATAGSGSDHPPDSTHTGHHESTPPTDHSHPDPTGHQEHWDGRRHNSFRLWAGVEGRDMTGSNGADPRTPASLRLGPCVHVAGNPACRLRS